MTSKTFGFIGLGNMGGPMATRLINAGHSLVVCDRDDAAVARLTALGAQRAATPADVANQVDTLFLSLPTPDIVEAVASVVDDWPAQARRAGIATADIAPNGSLPNPADAVGIVSLSATSGVATLQQQRRAAILQQVGMGEGDGDQQRLLLAG